MKNKILATLFLLISFMLLNTSMAVEIKSWKTSYSENEDVWLELKGKPGNVDDWIGIYPTGTSNDWSHVVSWVWARDTSVTQVDPGDWYKFEDPDSDYFNKPEGYGKYSLKLPAGNYEARFFLNNSYVVEDKVAFTIQPESTTQLTLDKQIYAPSDTVVVSYTGMLGGPADWLGIYQKGDNNNFANAKQWSWSNGQTEGSVSLSYQNLPAGEYEVRAFFNNSVTLEAAIPFSIVGKPFGARPVASTPVERGTLFASPNGNGNTCKKASPCHLQTAVAQLKAGSVLFLRDGIYPVLTTIEIEVSGTEAKPIIIESYPGEHAVLDGQFKTPNDIITTPNAVARPGLRVQTGSDYIWIRKLEVKNMSDAGIKLDSKYNIVEGCTVHGNHYNGIHISDGTKGYNAPYVNGFNTIRDNIIHDNSDVGLAPGQIPGSSYNYGNNADGIEVSSSRENVIEYNTVYDNSDDGIDTWRSNYSYVAHNLSYDNGRGNGNGGGIKTGSGRDAVTGLGAIVERNVSFNNRSRGFNYNDGAGVSFRYNTAYENGTVGFKTGQDTLVEKNISSSANGDSKTDTKAGHVSNSWQENGQVSFMSTDRNSPDFLRPTQGSIFETMGVYAQ